MHVSHENLTCAKFADHFPPAATYHIGKRLVDLTISILVILTIYPLLFPLIILMIKLDSKGPVFFKQKRAGLLGSVFVCFKFRTMHVNDEADIKAAVHGDTRITRAGQLLRQTWLDELPQFLNVVKGDMSIVGPRPQMLTETADFSKVIDDYFLRTMVRPGITGLSQVLGFRGPAIDFQQIYLRYCWDVYYVRKANWQLDFWIMAKTMLLMARSLSNRRGVPGRIIALGNRRSA
jgi:putative colanic acid biosynthesis UDP-glucose lipid carrier transferase